MSEQNLDELKQRLEQAETSLEFRRVQCVYLKENYGYSSQQIAEMTTFHAATVRRIQSEYRKDGMAALSPKPKGGRYHQNLSLEAEQVFVASLGPKAEEGQLLEISEIHRAYEEEVGRPVGKSTVYALLRRHDWRKVVPRPQHPKHDAQEAEAYKKKFLPLLNKPNRKPSNKGCLYE